MKPTWRVTRVEAENFLSFEKLDIRLDPYRGITLVVGNRGPGRSNGSGKSALLVETITFGLYGRTIRNLASVGKVIRRGSTKALVRLTLEIDHGDKGQTVMVERTRGSGTSVRISGFGDAATAAGGQAVIDAWFGDFDTWTRTYMFAGAASRFCELTDAQRKEFLEHLLRVGNYLAASELAKEQADKLERQTYQLDSAARDAEGQLQRALEERQAVGFGIIQRSARVMRDIAALRKAALAAYDVVREADSQVSAVYASLDEQRGIAEAKRVELQAAMDALQEKIDAKVSAQAEIRARITSADSNISAIQREITAIEHGKHPDICPTCGQRWGHDNNPDKVEHAVAQKKEHIFKLKRSVALERGEVTNTDNDIADLRQEMRNTKQALNSVVASTDDRALRRAFADYAAAVAELELAQRAHVEYLSTHDVGAEPGEIEAANEAVEVSRRAILVAKESLRENAEALADFQFWRKGFSRTGIPSYLIDHDVPEMNEVLAEVGDALTGGELSLRFNPSATKGTQQVFAVEAVYADGGEGYDAASRGECTRIDLAALLALRELAEKRGPSVCTQLFMDEVLDGTDEWFADCVMRMLRARYPNRQVFLVSHDPYLSNLCDGTITVVKKDGVSVVKG